ncbi:MAG: ubiquinol-cytochrome c reductase iron-sulfur subunit [Bacteroidia bacterium]
MDRKHFVKYSITAGAGVCALGLLHGCSLLDEPEMKVGRLSDLEEQVYIISRFNRKKILTTRLEGELVIFSLVCRHKRCTVAYEEDSEQFVCPCHEGIYDKYGQVVDGPPPAPLHRYKQEIRGNEIWVINEYLRTDFSTSSTPPA